MGEVHDAPSKIFFSKGKIWGVLVPESSCFAVPCLKPSEEPGVGTYFWAGRWEERQEGRLKEPSPPPCMFSSGTGCTPLVPSPGSLAKQGDSDFLVVDR